MLFEVASRAIGDFSIEAILAKRNQNPEFRLAQREVAVKAAKEKKKEKAKTTKAVSSFAFPCDILEPIQNLLPVCVGVE